MVLTFFFKNGLFLYLPFNFFINFSILFNHPNYSNLYSNLNLHNLMLTNPISELDDQNLLLK
jgi:hypothetical protein